MFSLYTLHNKNNGKLYVGQTSTSLAKRWRQHLAVARFGSPYYISKAIRKHGPDVFEMDEISSGLTKEQVNNLEKVWIILLQSSEAQYGYNCTLGGDGVIPNEETRYKMGNGARGVIRSAETREKIAAGHRGKRPWNYGIPRTEETKRKVSEGLKRYFAQRGSNGL